MARSPTALSPVLWPLLFGNFVIGTGVMVVPGTLNDLSRSLDVGVATAGQLVAAGALMMCVGAPLFATLAGAWDRRKLLALALVWYALLHLACTLASTFEVLLPLRALAVISPAIFTPQAAACVGLLVPPEQRGRAITFIFVGWSLASVLGMPLSAYVGETLGWRSAFAMVAAMSLVGAAWVWRSLPGQIKPPALSWRAWMQTLGSRPLMLCIAVTVLASAGQFVLFTYFAPYWHQQLGATASQMSLLFLAFGTFGFIGNVLMARHYDRLGPDRSVMAGLCAIALSLLLWPLGSSFALAALVAIPWALGCFATNSAQQARLVGIAPALASASVALNTSALYAGQAIGATVGGLLIPVAGFGELHWAALAGVLLAIAASTWAGRAAQRATPIIRP